MSPKPNDWLLGHRAYTSPDGGPRRKDVILTANLIWEAQVAVTPIGNLYYRSKNMKAWMELKHSAR